MLTSPTICRRNSETGQFEHLDINSFLLAENVILIEGMISNQVSEALNMIFFSYHTNQASNRNITIIMTNVECIEFKYVFSIYESIKFLQKKGFIINLQINGTITELAVLLALIDVPEKYISDTSIIQIRELKIDNSFSHQEISRLQAVDLIAHLEYYEKLEKKYFEILEKETRIPYDKIVSIHERMKSYYKKDLEDLGLSFIV